MHFKTAFIGFIPFLISVCSTLDCDIIPENISKPRNRNDLDRYIISIQGNPKSYTPNQKYNVSLGINPNKKPQKSFRQFFLTLESVEGSSATQSYRPTGQFEFETGVQMLTQFSDKCPNTVVENSKIPKREIQVYWIAPPENSGCIAIKATVVETRENWFSEDGQLTKTLCEDTEIDENVKPAPIDKCCACSEAKYEMAFEGRWTRNTHPRNFPSDIWSTKFSDIIGASHRKYHSFWNEQDYASEGLKDLAETGVTNTVESEIKEMGTNIRTIIKARGLQHPNITESSYAVFRVDNNNHLVSIATKITPSPDWFVGVANFELCQIDCTWIESYTLNLYPMDAGTDDGIGYMSSEPIRYSRKPIMPITPNNPNDPRSPFFSEDGDPMNPIAKIHFTRQRLYEKPCESSEQENSREENDCQTTNWGEWTPCSVPCGLGKRTRMRTYVDLRRATNCYVKLVQHQTCQGTAKYCTQNKNRGRPWVNDSSEDEQSENKDSNEEEGTKKDDSQEEKTNREDEEENRSKQESGSNEEKESKEKEDHSDDADSKAEKEDGDSKVVDETTSDEKGETSDENTDSKSKEENKSNETTDSKKERESEENADSGEKEKSNEEADSKEKKGSNEADGSEENGSAEDKGSAEEKGSEEDENSKDDDVDCTVGEWSEWSSCSVTCGSGTKTRDRRLLNPKNEDKCDVEFQENMKCKKRKCNDDDTHSMCTNNNWAPWSSCSVSCGSGIKRRLRLPNDNDENKSGSEESNCSNTETVKCHIPCNDNTRLGESLIVEQAPDGPVINCRTTNWSIWSKCQIRGGTCGNGTKKRYRQILRHPENGGRACPRKLIQSKRCFVPCSSSTEIENKPVLEEENKPECVMSNWTAFTPCSSICGSNAMQLKTRKILYKPPGVTCPPRVEYKPCNLPLACTEDGRPIFL